MRLTHIFLCLLPVAAFADELPLRVTSAQPVAVAGTPLTLQLTDVVDERCPPDVDCYWEGIVLVTVQVVNGANDPVMVTLCNLCEHHRQQARIGSYTLTYVQLDPSKADLATLGRAPILSDYHLTIALTD
ncbi:MAG: hypothetical protein ACRCS3_13050 [Paracoccaceae bacterium]